jgi:hypothetical protein
LVDGVSDTVRGEVAKNFDRSRSAPLRLPREFYLPETGPAPTKVSRPKDVLPIPPGMYLREAGSSQERNDKK